MPDLVCDSNYIGCLLWQTLLTINVRKFCLLTTSPEWLFIQMTSCSGMGCVLFCLDVMVWEGKNNGRKAFFWTLRSLYSSDTMYYMNTFQYLSEHFLLNQVRINCHTSLHLYDREHPLDSHGVFLELNATRVYLRAIMYKLHSSISTSLFLCFRLPGNL